MLEDESPLWRSSGCSNNGVVMVFIILLQQPQSILGIKSSRSKRSVKSIYDKRLFFEDRRLIPRAVVSPLLIFYVK